MGSVTAACRAGLRRSRKSGVPARTVIPLSTEATVHLVRCCIGRQSGFTLCDGGSCNRVSKNGQGGRDEGQKGASCRTCGCAAVELRKSASAASARGGCGYG